MKVRSIFIGASLALALAFTAPAARAQFSGQGPRDGFLDTSVLRPPAGSKVALIVFEDLGCPACARAHPLELEAVKQTHVTLLRYDFPLAAHVWTFEGAVCARYIQDHISPQLAGEFRSDVFASQGLIANKDDIDQFTATWLKKHGHTMPPVLDPDGTLAKEVSADFALGQRLNVQWTPTVVVVTRDQYQVVCGGVGGGGDPEKILPVVQAAIAQAK